MECPRCFFVSGGETVDERRCTVCGRGYRPAVNVYLGLVALVYIVLVRYLNYVLTGRFFDMRAHPETPWHLYRWARWPVDIQFRPELILVLGGMLALLVLVPVMTGILYGKRGGFLLAAVAFIIGPSWPIGALGFLCVWIAGGWTLRMRSKVGMAILGCVPAWAFYLVASRPVANVPLPTAYYTPAVAAVVIGLALILVLFVLLRLVSWNARWVGVALCVLCVVPIGAYKLAIGEDAIHYALLSRSVGLDSVLFRPTPVQKMLEYLREEIIKDIAEEQKHGRLPLETNIEQLLEARLNNRRIEFQAGTRSQVDNDRQLVARTCDEFLEQYPHGRHTADVLYTKAMALDMEVDITALGKHAAANSMIRFDSSRIRGEATRPLWEELLRDYPERRYAVVAMVKLADYEARLGDVAKAIAMYADVLQQYRSQKDAPLEGTTNLSVFTNLLDVGRRRKAEERAAFIDRYFRVAEREHAFLVENSGCPHCNDRALRAYLSMPLFEIPDDRRKTLTDLRDQCPKCKMADNLAYELAVLEPTVQGVMRSLTEITANADYAGSDGTALALFRLAEIKAGLADGDRIQLIAEAIQHYEALRKQYPESYLAPIVRVKIDDLERELEKLKKAARPVGGNPQ